MKQVKWRDALNEMVHGGIRLDNGDIICVCCGGLIPKDTQTKEYGFELLEEYENWVNLDEFIIGE